MKKRISLLIAMIMAIALVVVAFAAMPASAEESDPVASLYTVDANNEKTLVKSYETKADFLGGFGFTAWTNYKNDIKALASSAAKVRVEIYKNLDFDGTEAVYFEAASTQDLELVGVLATGETTRTISGANDPQIRMTGNNIYVENLTVTKDGGNGACFQTYAGYYTFNNCGFNSANHSAINNSSANLITIKGNSTINGSIGGSKVVLESGTITGTPNFACTTLEFGDPEITTARTITAGAINITGATTVNVNKGMTLAGTTARNEFIKITGANAVVNVKAGATVKAHTSKGSKAIWINAAATVNVYGNVEASFAALEGDSNGATANIYGGARVTLTNNSGAISNHYNCALRCASGNFAVTMYGGTIENLDTNNNSMIFNMGGCSFTMKDGTVETKGTKFEAFTMNGNNGSIKIEGGTLKGTTVEFIEFRSGKSGNKVEITGGTITTSGTLVNYASAGTVTISGGTVNGKIDVKTGSANAPAFKITGGKISQVVVKNGGFAEVSGTGKVETENSPVTVEAGGNLNVKGGTVNATGRYNVINNYGTVNVSGGFVGSKNADGTQTGNLRSFKLFGGSTTKVTGGEVQGGTYAIQYDNPESTSTAYVDISSGTITGSIALSKNCTATITGGTITGTVRNVHETDDAASEYDKAKITFTGNVNINLTLSCDSEFNNVTYAGLLTLSGGTHTITNSTFTNTAQTLEMKSGAKVTATNSSFSTTGDQQNVRVLVADFEATNCTFEAPHTGNNPSAFRIQGGNVNNNKAVLNNCTLSSGGTHPTVRAYEGHLTLNNCKVSNTSTVTGVGYPCAVGDIFGAGTIVINGGNYTSKIGTAVIRVAKASDVTLNNVHVECILKGDTAAGAVVVDSGAGAAKLTINGGTYISDARPVIRNWSTNCTFNMDDVKIYSTGTWSNAYWAWASEGGTGTKDNWVAFVRSPAGSAEQFTGGQFDVANAECSVVINGTTYYVYTGDKGGAPATNDGASVRIEGEDAGLRFTSYISIKTINAAEAAKKAGTTVEYGTAIFPTALIEDAGLDTFDPLALEELGYTVAWVKTVEGQTAVKDANDNVKGYTIRGALTNIKASRYGWKYSAIAYIKYTDVNGEDVYLFGNYDEAQNSRSIAEVANAALKDLSPDREGKYIYKVTVIENGEPVVKYSPYTTSQRAVLEDYIYS